jgi:hypothetical protein
LGRRGFGGFIRLVGFAFEHGRYLQGCLLRGCSMLRGE